MKFAARAVVLGFVLLSTGGCHLLFDEESVFFINREEEEEVISSQPPPRRDPEKIDPYSAVPSLQEISVSNSISNSFDRDLRVPNVSYVGETDYGNGLDRREMTLD